MHNLTKNNYQELIHYIHCFGYVFCHQTKTMNFCWFYKFLYYDLFNISYSAKNINSLWFIVIVTFLFPHFAFLYPHCRLPKTNTSLISTWQTLPSQHHWFHLSFYQRLICLNHHNIFSFRFFVVCIIVR